MHLFVQYKANNCNYCENFDCMYVHINLIINVTHIFVVRDILLQFWTEHHEGGRITKKVV